MNIDINTIINLILTAVVGYISWTFKERDAKKETRIQDVEKDVKDVRKEVSQNDTKYYREFVTKEQHDMDINAVMKKLDEINASITSLNRDIGTLIGRNQTNGK